MCGFWNSRSAVKICFHSLFGLSVANISSVDQFLLKNDVSFVEIASLTALNAACSFSVHCYCHWWSLDLWWIERCTELSTESSWVFESSLAFVGSEAFLMTRHLFSVGDMPSGLNLRPKKLSSCRQNWHLDRLSVSPFSSKRFNTALRIIWLNPSDAPSLRLSLCDILSFE